MTTVERFVARLELVERLEAVVAELRPGGDGPDVARVLAEGTIEEIVAVLEDERIGHALTRRRVRDVMQAVARRLQPAGTPLQSETRATFTRFEIARERLGEDAYRAYMFAIHRWVETEIARLTAGELLHLLREVGDEG